MLRRFIQRYKEDNQKMLEELQAHGYISDQRTEWPRVLFWFVVLLLAIMLYLFVS